MSSELSVELLVIGWGKAGKTLAKRWAATGRSVAMVEKSPQMYGGTCINIACVPTKDLIVSAQRRRPQEYFTQAVAGRDSLIGKLNAANHRMLEGQAELVDGTARFISSRKVAVDTADGELIITAETVVLGTGAVPAHPDIPGIDLPRVYDSTSIQHADPLPQRLAIIGGGFIGLEFAQMFQHFGSQVTVLGSGENFLRRAAPSLSWRSRCTRCSRRPASSCGRAPECSRSGRTARPSFWSWPTARSRPMPCWWQQAAPRPPPA